MGNYQFAPAVIDSFFLDDIDYYGLLYWYEDAKETAAEIKKNSTQKQ